MSHNWRISELFQWLDADALLKLKDYGDALEKWTGKINLISPKSVKDLDIIHFSDAIMGSRFFLKDLRVNQELFDLGSGNGIPGLVLSILRPDLPICCVDSDQRKIAFIRQMSLNLNLKNLRTLNFRVEDLPKDSIAVATARGFSSLKNTLSQFNDVFSSGSVVYHYKGQDFARELLEIPNAGAKWSSSVVGEYNLPFDSGRRAIIKSTWAC